tara:strand:- start:29238 stop:30563 length:1326 start_codon:yes stop_codon:yes gene_type:complete
MKDLESFLLGKGQKLYKDAKHLIPGGTQLLSKRPEMFAPDIWPSYFSRAKGSRIWDLDNNEYVDMSIMAVGACILGYADDDVDKAVSKAIKNGVNSTLNCYEEVDLAKLLLQLHPWFDCVRYARSGGEAMSIAVRIARAKTDKQIILFSGYHGWSDWYLAANLSDDNALDGQLMPGLDPKGVPRNLRGTAFPFDFNNIDTLKEAIQNNEEIAAVVIEPARGEEPDPKHLEEIQNIAKKAGAVLIFDEITSGFRMCPGGIHRKYGVYPDIAVFAKSMANGYAMAAILGKENIMEAAQSTFISSTNWTDRIGPTAAISTIEKYVEEDAHDHLIRIGNRVKEIWREAADEAGLEVAISGLPTLANFAFKHSKSKDLNTRFVSEMLKHGFLAFRQFKPSLAHTDQDIDSYEKATKETFTLLSSLSEARIAESPLAHDGFSRLTKE